MDDKGRSEVSILIGVWFAAAGGLAGLVGLSGMRRVRRLRRDGVATWAAIVEPPAGADEPLDGSSRRTLIQYTLTDGRVIERIFPAPGRKAALLRPGQKVLVWYDPEDPQDILVYGREGRFADRAFLAAGLIFLLIGTGIAITSLSPDGMWRWFSPDDLLADRAQYEHGEVDEAADDHDHPDQEHGERRPGGVERGPRARVGACPGE